MKNKIKLHNLIITHAVNEAVDSGVLDLKAPANFGAINQYRSLEFTLDGDIRAKLWTRPFQRTEDTPIRVALWPTFEGYDSECGTSSWFELGDAYASAYIERTASGLVFIPYEPRPTIRCVKPMQERLHQISVPGAYEDPLNLLYRPYEIAA